MSRENNKGKLPLADAYELNDEPLVLIQYESDFERQSAELAVWLEGARKDERVHVLLQLGYEHETPALADSLAEAVKAFLVACPRAEVIILCNTPREVEGFEKRGVRAVFCHQNAFLDAARYPILPLPKVFDAVYLARLTPVKRHLLLETLASPKLLLAGATELAHEHDYAEEVRRRLASAVRIGRFHGLDAARLLCSARCGLMLSPREGASFATAEYALCGLPVVNTPSMGGRELLSPPAYRLDVAPESGAIAAAIAHWGEKAPDPRDVRKAFLDLAEPHRETFRKLMYSLTGRRPASLPHKLGLRVPRTSRLRAAAAWLYLRQMILRAHCHCLSAYEE